MLLFNQLKNTTILSTTERKIADYILNNYNLVINMGIKELASETYSSPSSITRFCKKLNTNGFSEFKIKLASEINSFQIRNERIEDDLPFTSNENPKQIADNILNLNFQSLNDTFNELHLKDLQRISLLIHHAPHIYMYGEGQSLILAQDLQYKLFRINKDVHLESQVGFQNLKASTQPSDSIAIIISYYGRSKSNLRIIKRLYEQNIPSILITGPSINPLCAYANEIIHVPAQEELMKKMASYSSRTAIQLVIDILYALVFSLDYEKNKSIIES